MPDLLDPAAGTPPAERPDGYDPPPGTTPYYITLTPDEIVRFKTHDLMDGRLNRGELEAYRGETVIATPDGSVLEATDMEKEYYLVAAIKRAEEKAGAVGIPPGRLTYYYVPPLEC